MELELELRGWPAEQSRFSVQSGSSPDISAAAVISTWGWDEDGWNMNDMVEMSM
jgi:hypothetical protein